MCHSGTQEPESPTVAADAGVPIAGVEEPCPNAVKIIILPRSKANVFDSPQSRPINAVDAELKDLLPGYVPTSMPSYANLRAIEVRFYIDISVNQGGTYHGHRKLTAILVNADGSPYANQPVEWSRQAGSTALRFMDSSGQLQAALTGGHAVLTDAEGMAEVTIVHPAATVAGSDAQLTIKAMAGTESAQINITITRNDTATRIDDIARRTLTDADDIWVYQPDSGQRTPRNDGIRELQEVLNEVVSRHRAINPFTFLTRDGLFADQVRTAVEQYRTNFINVRRGDHYPYDLSGIGPSQHLTDYIRDEYAPFDPNAGGNAGWIIDRRLLIGDSWDINHTRIDGLCELYDGVVQVLKGSMREYGQSYLNCTSFWLHRPLHGPYQPATDQAFGCHHNGEVLRTAASDTAPELMASGNPVTMNDGDHLLVITSAGGWIQVNHTSGPGWIRRSRGSVVNNDAGRFRNTGNQVRNHGNHGAAGTGYNQRHTRDGVAYSYGAKQTPQEWTNSLNGNPHANPMQICHYDEYRQGHRLGERKTEYDAGDFRYREAGCDCSGFVQNCISHAVFFGTNIRITPQNITPAGGAGSWRGSGQFIGNAQLARPVPRPLSSEDTHWVRGADLIQRPGHIVMVAEDVPDMVNDGVNFMIFQESGGSSSADTSQFRRKSIRSPFNWWDNSHAGFSFGKPFIWR